MESQMTRMSAGSFTGLFGVVLAFTAVGHTYAQETQPAPSATPQSALPAAPAVAPEPTVEPAKTEQPIVDKKDAPAMPTPKSAGVATAAVKGKKGKVEYTGPTTIVVLPPTPMLDEEGKQRQDPDGKLMFNPPVKQQRDKKGHPLFDAQNKPVMQTKTELGYDENGKKLHALKEKPIKPVSVLISRGTLTVDGMTGKAALNYDIKDLKYLYFYVPGIGTTVVSNLPFPGGSEQKNAFNDVTLTVTVGDHSLQLTSDKRILAKKGESAFVRVDKNFSIPAKFPVMGYGPLRVAPYAWPGSKSSEELKDAAVAPPLPANLLPVMLLQPCPQGQMRMGAPSTPGQTSPPQPCVPIVLGKVPATSTTQATTSTEAPQTKN
jgi:hypothetical protein